MKQGFTMLEMIVVISIISVLFLLEIPNIQKTMQNIDNKGCDALLKVVDSAILEFKLEFNDYPDDVYDLVNAGYLSEQQVKCHNNERIVIINGQATLS